MFIKAGYNVTSMFYFSSSVPPHIDERMFQLGSGFPAGSRARIMCVVDRGDLPLSFSWAVNDKPVHLTSTVSIR